MSEPSGSLPDPIGPVRPERPKSIEALVKILARVAIFVLLLIGVAAYWFYSQVQGSLPALDGEVRLAGLEQPVTVERDHQGVPTIRAETRLDLSMALGFLHAQERFFQMDLMRRRGAGELSALLGEAALSADRRFRLHRFRARAEAVVEQMEAGQAEQLAAYTQGINAGLQELDAIPFEYLILGVQPQPWLLEDSLLVIYSMYFELNDFRGRHESARGLIHDLLGQEMLEFLAPWGTDLDAPIEGEVFPSPGPPGQMTFDVLSDISELAANEETFETVDPGPLSGNGSNNWAVAGEHTRHGGAMLANDMHLPLRVPNIWYRASLVYPEPEDPSATRRVTGVSLPGAAPSLVVGSNGHVAWGLTNAYGDWVDLVILEEVEPGVNYLTPDGPVAYETLSETIEVKGAESETLKVLETIWGPVLDKDHQGRPRAVRWIAHDRQAITMHYLDLESTRSVQEAIEVAHRIGTPPQNFVAADDRGDIAWTILGTIPRRFGHDGRLPTSWADGSRGWDGYLTSQEVPRVVNPEQGRIWTANSRVVGGEKLARIGLGDYALGARARQIRDGLFAIDDITERDLLAIQLDDRALFLDRWRDLLLETLDDEATEGNPARHELASLVAQWDGAASTNSTSYRLVRAFRTFLSEQVFDSLTSACREADESFSYSIFQQREGPLWHLVTQRPAHMLDPAFSTWNEQLLSAADATLDYFGEREGTLADRTWGERNTSAIQHPLSQFIPGSGRWLDMEPVQLPGDSNMPRVQGPSFGASERIVVSPGREEEGIFHMATGQSGHPMSPYYRLGHEDWVEGKPSAFLPGDTVYHLTLLPPGPASSP